MYSVKLYTRALKHRLYTPKSLPEKILKVTFKVAFTYELARKKTLLPAYLEKL